MRTNPRYPVILRPLSENEGGGWIAIVPDLPGCMSDGATGQEAFDNVLDAIDSWESDAEADGISAPEPDSAIKKFKWPVPAHLKPQIDALVKQFEASQSDHISRDQIMAGILLQMMRGGSFNSGANH